MLESPRELAINIKGVGDYFDVGSARVYGIFDNPQAEELLVEGTAPAFTAVRLDLLNNGITIGSVITEIVQGSSTGEKFGPFRVVRWQNDVDGVLVVIRLEDVS